jgi:hypothetical protein
LHIDPSDQTSLAPLLSLSFLHPPKPIRPHPTTADEETRTGGAGGGEACGGRLPGRRCPGMSARCAMREMSGRVCLRRPAPSYTVTIPSSQEFSYRVACIPANPPPSRSSPCPFHCLLRRLAAPAIRAAAAQICKEASPMPYKPDSPRRIGPGEAAASAPQGAGGRLIGCCCSCHGCVHGGVRSEELGAEGGDDFVPTARVEGR